MLGGNSSTRGAGNAKWLSFPEAGASPPHVGSRYLLIRRITRSRNCCALIRRSGEACL